MRRLLGTSLVVLALSTCLGGCGSDGDPTATDPGAPSAPPSSEAPTGAWTVQIVSATAAGGRPNPVATPIDTPAALASFTAQFRSPAMQAQLEQALRGLDADTVLAAVVATGCDAPPDATVEQQGDRVVVVPAKVADPLPECLAPVTSVAVVSR